MTKYFLAFLGKYYMKVNEFKKSYEELSGHEKVKDWFQGKLEKDNYQEHLLEAFRYFMPGIPYFGIDSQKSPRKNGWKKI